METKGVALGWFTKSLGFKRIITSFVLLLISLCQTNEKLAPYLPLLKNIGAVLGGAGLIHAVAQGTIGSLKAASFASLYAVVLSLVGTTPALLPFLPVLSWLSTVFGAAGIGEALGKADVISNPTSTAKIIDNAHSISQPNTQAPLIVVAPESAAKAMQQQENLQVEKEVIQKVVQEKVDNEKASSTERDDGKASH